MKKFYKTIIETVKTKKKPVILTTNKKPQAALISLEDLEELKRAKSNNAALEMPKLAIDNKEELKSLPANLRDKANDII